PVRRHLGLIFRAGPAVNQPAVGIPVGRRGEKTDHGARHLHVDGLLRGLWLLQGVLADHRRPCGHGHAQRQCCRRANRAG
ncbi:hypothetical protein BN1723_020656, partial [Verticillium longisporum]